MIEATNDIVPCTDNPAPDMQQTVEFGIGGNRAARRTRRTRRTLARLMAISAKNVGRHD